jgi:hypothetical protein
MQMTMCSKYNSRKVTAPDGQKFDSVKEYHRWGCLRLLERAGRITDLKRQVIFELIPKQDGERACHYVADFTYIQDGQLVVEDVKGYKRGQAYSLFSIKRKLMLWVHGIRVKEV